VSDFKFNERNLQVVMGEYLLNEKKQHLVIPNIKFFHQWESDILAVSRSWYATEYEIKCSRSDFKADFKKQGKHHCLEKGTGTFKYLARFYYVTPKGLLDPSEVPEYAGLIEVEHSAYFKYSKFQCKVREVKKAPRFRSVKPIPTEHKRDQILRSLMWKVHGDRMKQFKQDTGYS